MTGEEDKAATVLIESISDSITLCDKVLKNFT